MYLRNDGNAVITSPIPDTITSWFISAFAMDRVSGLGIAPHVAKVDNINHLSHCARGVSLSGGISHFLLILNLFL